MAVLRCTSVVPMYRTVSPEALRRMSRVPSASYTYPVVDAPSFSSASRPSGDQARVWVAAPSGRVLVLPAAS
ncbi:hypothetical protein BBN63_13060 [Streptomyces niveus]|uniref:Uncharacterized protein n=1 Tax=Streptomyces niveus TaxID=193462 RepID=A0A1U9QSH7_STRNV|nr:hypothetical protein BBN63_13060 [Streptomyces niveus]